MTREECRNEAVSMINTWIYRHYDDFGALNGDDALDQFAVGWDDDGAILMCVGDDIIELDVTPCKLYRDVKRDLTGAVNDLFAGKYDKKEEI